MRGSDGNPLKTKGIMARPAGFEPATPAFGGKRSKGNNLPVQNVQLVVEHIL